MPAKKNKTKMTPEELKKEQARLQAQAEALVTAHDKAEAAKVAEAEARLAQARAEAAAYQPQADPLWFEKVSNAWDQLVNPQTAAEREGARMRREAGVDEAAFQASVRAHREEALRQQAARETPQIRYRPQMEPGYDVPVVSPAPVAQGPEVEGFWRRAYEGAKMAGADLWYEASRPRGRGQGLIEPFVRGEVVDPTQALGPYQVDPRYSPFSEEYDPNRDTYLNRALAYRQAQERAQAQSNSQEALWERERAANAAQTQAGINAMNAAEFSDPLLVMDAPTMTGVQSTAQPAAESTAQPVAESTAQPAADTINDYPAYPEDYIPYVNNNLDYNRPIPRMTRGSKVTVNPQAQAQAAAPQAAAPQAVPQAAAPQAAAPQGIPHITQQAKFAVNPQAQAQEEPWYNPNVSSTIQVGTPSSDIRGPQQVMVGYSPQDGGYAGGYYVDQYGNVTVPYDRQYLQYIDPYGRIPQGVYAAAPNRDPRWHWSVINAEDAALRQAGGLYLDKIEAAFDRVVNGVQGGPELYQVQPGTVQERPYYREDAGWMIQPLFNVPSRRVSDGQVIEGTGGGLQIESNPIMDAAGVPLSLQEHGANVYHAMLSRGYDEWTATRAALKAMMDADSGFNGEAYLRTAMAQARGVSDNPQYNYMNNLGWDASSIQAQKKNFGAELNVPDTMGNVQTSKNIRLAPGVNFTKINDELKRRANTLADILKNEYGMTLVISSGYRTKAQQAAILAKGTGYMTAQPGRSKHQYGKAFDVAINSHMKPQFYKNKKAMQQYGGNFNAFWADMTRRAGLYRFSPNGDPPHHTLPPGTQYGGSSRRMNNPQYANTVRPGNNISMSPNITVDKGVRWDGLHSYMKELLNHFGDNMVRKYGIKPHFRHMHRTKADQQPHYDAYRSGKGGIAARPGHSFHQAGLAADLDWPRIQAFFNKRADLKKAYNNNFWRFIDDELRQVGLYRSLGMRDRPHIQPIKNDRYYARVNHNALMSSRGAWDMGGASFELHQPHVRGGRLNIGYMYQPVNTEARETNTIFRTSGNRPNAPGMRINNPFNLKHINGLRPGEIPRNKIGEARKHATFDTLASGVNAGVRDIVYHKFIRRGINNISDFVDIYLGAAVKNDPRAKPEQYKSNLERMMGIRRNQHIDVRNEDMMVRFLASVLDNETGSSKYIGTNNLRMAYRKVMSDVLSGRR